MNAGRFAALAAIGWLAMATAAFAADPPRPLVTDPVYLGPARLVDIGGRRLNLYCRGSGSPVVIFDAGMNDSTIAWAWVQPEISKTHMTCSYDRAGIGFSDASNRPSTASADVDDIRKALQVAHIKPPYLLVGHSAAGLAVRVFADRYRNEVVGMVIVDGSHEDQTRKARERAALEASEVPALAHHDAGPEPDCLGAAKGGAIPKDSPAYKPCVGEMYEGVSEAITNATLARTATLTWQTAYASEMANFDTVSADEARATRHDFGDMPIIMLTHSPNPAPKGTPQAIQDRRTVDWEQLHNEVAAMSTHGVNWIVPRSTHTINHDRPEIVIDAIDMALDIAAKQAR
jgi:pimeloyl-ACP methyl ester carboxylesterase